MAQIKELLFFTYEWWWVNKSTGRSPFTAVFLEPMEPMEPMWMEACSFSNYGFHSCSEVVSIPPSWEGKCARRVHLGGANEPLATPDWGGWETLSCGPRRRGEHDADEYPATSNKSH